MTKKTDLAFVIAEQSGIDRHDEPVRVSLPVPQGFVEPGTNFAIASPDGGLRSCQSRALKTWPDGSVKWLLVDFFVSVEANSKTTWEVLVAKEDLPPPKGVAISQAEGDWLVDTGAGKFIVDGRFLRPFKSVTTRDGVQLACATECKFSLADGSEAVPNVHAISIEDGGPLHSVIAISGKFEKFPLHFLSRVHFYAGKLQVRIDVRVHNPQAASHPHGLWDLGDPGSVEFSSLEFQIDLPNDMGGAIHCRPGLVAEAISVSAGELSVYQESSGGENWNSPNHRGKNGEVAPQFCGYRVYKNGRIVTEGKRSLPTVWTGNGSQGVAAAIPKFWQNFPKKLSVAGNQLKIGLFPGEFPEKFELQGGEQKSHCFGVDFFAKSGDFLWFLSPLAAMASPACFNASAVHKDLPGEKDIVDQFASANDFLQKREAIDEYGWRNFGDVYADHEAVLAKEAVQFISHFNNQYDLISGFHRKAFSTGDFCWSELATDLAAHVADIDMYHTSKDRCEYNNGLFWHTDHYTDAGLATHRSYSREQVSQYGVHAGGGGPGNEHCYTTGLATQFFLTGDPEYKRAAMDMASWQMISLSGPPTVLASFKRFIGNLKILKANQGQKETFPRYPFHRGTGNAIVACLDAFELTDEKAWLDEAGTIIKGSIHPRDDIEARSLDNIELWWSYVVLLSAIGKFLEVKAVYGDLDSDFEHARQSLVEYAKWMVENEYPYLEKPERLEFPSETWPAQELRKCVVLYYAAKFVNEESYRKKFFEKGLYLFEEAQKNLSSLNTSRFTRPVALMLQNGWISQKLADWPRAALDSNPDVEIRRSATPLLTLASVIRHFLWDLGRSLSKTSLRRELDWLRARL